jgi:hypothetical protein
VKTRGQDITELFESSHVGPKASALLSKYRVGECRNARRSPFTFAEDGFYRTLKRRVWPILKQDDTCALNALSQRIQDCLLASFLTALLAAAYFHLLPLVLLAGVLLALSCVCAHNFFHKVGVSLCRCYAFLWMCESTQ